MCVHTKAIINMSKRLHNPKSHAPAVYIPCWLLQVPANHLSHAAKITYGRLSQWANEKGMVYRSAKQLAEEIGTSERSVERHLNELRYVELIGTYLPQAGGVNHFEFYDHPWMHEPINENLVYKSDKNYPPTELSVPPDRIVGTPPTELADINKKEIKINKIRSKHTSSCVKPENLTVEDIVKNNPHEIPAELIAEWKRSRKKPITQRVLNAFNKELSLIAEAGIAPLNAVNKMLDKQWSTVELRFFSNDIAFEKSKSFTVTTSQRERPGASLSRVLAKHTQQNGGVYDQYGNSVNPFGR